jgi:hypothetical protein
VLRKAGSNPRLFACPNLHIFDADRNESSRLRLMDQRQPRRHSPMNSIIYIVGLIVIVMAILSFIGLA